MDVCGTNKRNREEESEMEEESVAEKPLIKVAAICGSLRKASYNRGLIRAAIELTKEEIEGVHVEYIEISALPMLNTDLEVDGTYPPEVEEFRRKVLEADSCLFASPDYNYSITPLLKNALDWGSRPPNVWAGKGAAAVSAVGGGRRAQFHLRQIGVYLDLHFINKPEFYLNAHRPPGKFNTNSGDLVDSETKENLKEMILSLQAFTLRLLGKG
ncbi:NADPH:quinone oxidoreductase isoform X1 [Cajanus cajan]|uniref:NADPH:quinone oxidoreductase isoform X1 n=1 Tax=Cajanus cajan TaxID=3821 RepID=UPI00098DA32E|nr:NADPH:quinone oxidoreductase isoform X1 [Cajanus cajan]